MSNVKISPRNTVLLLIIVFTAIVRLTGAINMEYNPFVVFTPIGAMALFGGSYFRGNIKPFLLPLVALLASDVVLSFTAYSSFRVGLLYPGWFWVYLAFGLMTMAGKILIKRVTIRSVGLATLVTVMIHWLVSDIGGCLAEVNTAGVLSTYRQRLISALPYELNFLAATSIYSAILFGTFEWMQRRNPSLRTA